MYVVIQYYKYILICILTIITLKQTVHSHMYYTHSTTIWCVTRRAVIQARWRWWRYWAIQRVKIVYSPIPCCNICIILSWNSRSSFLCSSNFILFSSNSVNILSLLFNLCHCFLPPRLSLSSDSRLPDLLLFWEDVLLLITVGVPFPLASLLSKLSKVLSSAVLLYPSSCSPISVSSLDGSFWGCESSVSNKTWGQVTGHVPKILSNFSNYFHWILSRPIKLWLSFIFLYSCLSFLTFVLHCSVFSMLCSAKLSNSLSYTCLLHLEISNCSWIPSIN